MNALAGKGVIFDFGGIEPDDRAISLFDSLISRGARIGVVSPGNRWREHTGTARFPGTPPAVADGKTAQESGELEHGMLLRKVEELGLEPWDCVVIATGEGGVKAGRSGNFSLVAGITREHTARELFRAGADIVVRDESEITEEVLDRHFAQGRAEDLWKLAWQFYDPAGEKLRETLTTIGNGRFGTRGAFCGQSAVDDIHYPGTYISGVYDAGVTEVHGRAIRNNDLVNCPNWLLLRVKIADNPFIGLDDLDLLSYRHELDMRKAVVSRVFRFRDPRGRITRIEIETFASMDCPCAGALLFTLVPENYDDTILVRSSLDGTVVNDGVPRYRSLKKDHLAPLGEGRESDLVYLDVMTKASGYRISIKAKTDLFGQNGRILVNRKLERKEMLVTEEFRFTAEKGKRYEIEKIVEILASTGHPFPCVRLFDGRNEVRYRTLKADHTRAWDRLWSRGDMELEGDRFAARVLRLHAYHLLSTASPLHFPELDTGFPARGLTGEAYRGHIFWDGLFILPWFTMRFPETVKAVLLYRYRRLDDARRNARENGYEGAMYPWQTADTGREETQEIHFNPVSNTWDPDRSRLQRHVSIAVAYNIWEYFKATYDRDFLRNYGMEMLIETARFWMSTVTLDAASGRYHIEGVMGPDEFHEKYPHSERGGLRDNAYTNIMVSWLVHKTIESVEYLPPSAVQELLRSIHFAPGEIERWKDIVKKLAVPIRSDGVIEQFAGYSQLETLDLSVYKAELEDIRRMDRILKARGDSPDRYQVAKQADTLMLFYLLSPGQVAHILRLMGYDPGDPVELLEKNFSFYLPKTTHGSTLSYVVFSGILKYLPGHETEQWNWYLTALESDIGDLQGGTTEEAIHCGVMGGTLDLAVRTFAGLAVYRDRLEFEPKLPRHWRKLAFRIFHRGSLFRFELGTRSMTATLLMPGETLIGVVIQGTRVDLDGNRRTCTVDWQEPVHTIPAGGDFNFRW